MVIEDVETFQRSRFDLIFMDYNMPILDGCEATAQIRDFLFRKGLEQPLIIGISADTEDYIAK